MKVEIAAAVSEIKNLPPGKVTEAGRRLIERNRRLRKQLMDEFKKKGVMCEAWVDGQPVFVRKEGRKYLVMGEKSGWEETTELIALGGILRQAVIDPKLIG
jgi:hypothetical protein